VVLVALVDLGHLVLRGFDDLARVAVLERAQLLEVRAHALHRVQSVLHLLAHQRALVWQVARKLASRGAARVAAAALFFTAVRHEHGRRARQLAPR
jgi:hypothetical protein